LPEDRRVTSLYEADFASWIDSQVRAIRKAAQSGTNLPIDFDNIAEELADMGRSEKRALKSALVRIIEHLLKLEHSPASGPRAGWRRSVAVHRQQAADIVADSPSLGGLDHFEDAYDDARQLAILGLQQDGVMDSALPEECPYSRDQVMDRNFWPVNRHGIAG
jgi:hypothetical protein